MNWHRVLQDHLLTLHPASAHALDDTALQLLTTTLPEGLVSKPGETPAQPCKLALGIEVCGELGTSEAQRLISQTRLYIASRIVLAERPDSALDEHAFRALGFTVLAVDGPNNMNLYEYDLDTYKTVPDWLNARYWAHPERWKP